MTPSELEPQLVAEFFRKTDGYFVEVGANEPTRLSQTWHLERLGWRGVLVEPQPDMAEQLRQHRSALVFEAACTCPDLAGRDLQLHVAGPLSSLDRNAMAPGARAISTVTVKGRTLDSILDEAHTPSGFDLLSIDVEGHELEVLRGFNFNRWRPKLVLIEDHVSDLARHSLMRKAGYKIIRRHDLNGWYVPTEYPADISTSQMIEICRKYYLALPFRKVRNFSRKFRQS